MTASVFSRSYPEPVIREAEILRYARCPQPTCEVLELLHSCIERVRAKLQYRVCWREFPVSIQKTRCELGFATVISRDLAKNMENCDRIILFAASIGLEIDREIQRAAVLSPAQAVLLQAFGAERVEALCDQFDMEMQTQAQQAGMFTRPRFSPGYGDLPLSIQPEIFHALDCSRRLGLTLNASFLMSPTKSVTALIGLGKQTRPGVPGRRM